VLVKTRSVALLVCAEIAAMSLWFVSAAILPEMAREAVISPLRQAMLSSGVQAGFVIGALASAVSGLADRFDPRRVFVLAALGAAAANLLLLAVPPGHGLAILARLLTGILLAGVYPVGMKIAVGWGNRDRGFLVGLLVGALTLGSAAPHLLALLGGAEWRNGVLLASALAAAGGLLVLGAGLGPHHAQARRFDTTVIPTAWRDRRIRLAYAGYLGHMWELYAMWAWLAAALTASYSLRQGIDAAWLGRLTTFLAIAGGAFACLAGGHLADRIGKAQVAMGSMMASALAALAVAASFGGPVWLVMPLAIVWGITIIPDSAQFSALVADAAPPDQAGSLMTLQTALGFALTFFTVQFTPLVAEALGWPATLAIMALGPVFGVIAMRRLIALDS